MATTVATVNHAPFILSLYTYSTRLSVSQTICRHSIALVIQPKSCADYSAKQINMRNSIPNIKPRCLHNKLKVGDCATLVGT